MQYRQYRDHIDPEYQRWGQKYHRFPGVAECARLIRARKAKGTWADIIVDELAEHATECLDDLIAEFHGDPTGGVRVFVMMALEIARPPATVLFLVDVLREGDPQFVPYAERTLKGINTRDARTALWNAARP
jgi:hypothetical protein